MPTWHVGDEFLITHDRRLRILAIDAELPDELVEQGINAVWVVAAVRRPTVCVPCSSASVAVMESEWRVFGDRPELR